MPRIIGTQEPQGPGAVIDLPRPRHVGAAPTGLPEFGQAIHEAGQLFLTEVVRQERSAENTRISSEAEAQWSALQGEVEAAGTATEARALWMARAPKVRDELVRFAEQRGLPEAIPGLQATAKANDIEVHNFIGKRSVREGLDAATAFAAAKQEAIVASRTEGEATRHRTDLHRELQRVAQNNPLLSPAAADQLYRKTTSDASLRRVQKGLAERANSPDALQQYAAAIRDGSVADLPADDREILASRAEAAADQARLHSLAMQDRMEAREERMVRRAREANEAGWRVRVARGEATEAELIGALDQRDISTDAFNGLIRAMETDASDNDHPATAIELRHRMYLGDANSSDVMEARNSGLLSQDTTEELLRLDNELGRREDSPLTRDSVKRARDFMVDSITGPRGPLGQLLDPNDAAREASAVREMDERVLAGEDPWAVAEQLIPQFRVTSQQPLTAIGKPIGLVGTLREPDVPATAQALIDMLERGEITSETFEREIDRLERLGAASTDAQLKRQEAEAAARSRQ